MTYLSLLIFTAIIMAIELIYFQAAISFGIVDKPNHRSSHVSSTIRGGGIIFSISVFIFFIYNGLLYPWFAYGLFFISLISFLDDIWTLNSKIRLAVQFVSSGFLLVEWWLFDLPQLYLPIIIFIILGITNAYNFMDGINGITGIYSLVTIVTLYYINIFIVHYVSSDLLAVVGVSLLVFIFFNFRTKARCFAGDVGSVSIAFIIIFFIGQLILKSQNMAYAGLLVVYGLDVTTTMVFRLIRKENLSIAHRLHFYQFLVNEKHYSHLFVAALYGILQLGFNFILIFFQVDSLLGGSALALIAVAIFTIVRFYIEGTDRILRGGKLG